MVRAPLPQQELRQARGHLEAGQRQPDLRGNPLQSRSVLARFGPEVAAEGPHAASGTNPSAPESGEEPAGQPTPYLEEAVLLGQAALVSHEAWRYQPARYAQSQNL